MQIRLLMDLIQILVGKVRLLQWLKTGNSAIIERFHWLDSGIVLLFDKLLEALCRLLLHLDNPVDLFGRRQEVLSSSEVVWRSFLLESLPRDAGC